MGEIDGRTGVLLSGQSRSGMSMLFFYQVCLLAAVSGVLAFRHPPPGLFCLGLLVLLDLPRSKRPLRLLCLALAFAGGMGYAEWRQPLAPPVPAWLAEAAAPLRPGTEQPPAAIRIQGLVLESTPLSGKRLRVLLGEARPARSPASSVSPDAGAAAPYQAYQGVIAWTWYRPEALPLSGQRVEATLRLVPMRGMSNPDVWNIEEYWQDRGVWFRAWSGSRAKVALSGEASWFAKAREALRSRFLEALPGESAEPSEAAAILPALLFGDRSGIAEEQRDLFARSTLAHSLSLSGLHLGYACMIGLFFAWVLSLCLPRTLERLPRPAAALLFACPLAAGYLWLGNMPVSLLRAACMLFFWTLLFFRKNPGLLLDGLLAALAALLLLNPLSLFDVGLQLSVVSVAVIALSLPFLRRLSFRLVPFIAPAPVGVSALAQARTLLSRQFRRFLRWALVLSGISLCIQVALLPITLRVFGTVGLCFFLNLLWLPALAFLVMPPAVCGLALAGIPGLEDAAALCLHLASLPCEALMDLLRLLDAAGWLKAPLMPRPQWPLAAAFWLLCLALPALVRARAGRLAPAGLLVLSLCLLVLPLALQDARKAGVRLRLLDVGQGQSVLLEWSGLPESGRALIDGGGFSSPTFDIGRSIIAPVLTDNALPRLGTLINSHPDTDHLGGLLYILEHARVNRYYSNGDSPPAALAQREQAALRKRSLRRETLRSGDSVTLAPGLRLDVLWPRESPQPSTGTHSREDRNNASLILRLVWNGVPLALFCGDAESPALLALMEHADLSASVLVLPHHGSSASLAPGFHERVNPTLALASCGYANQWGFVSIAVRKALSDRHIPLLTTAGNGQVQVHWTHPGQVPRVQITRGE